MKEYYLNIFYLEIFNKAEFASQTGKFLQLKGKELKIIEI